MTESSTAGQVIRCKAAVALDVWDEKDPNPLTIQEIEVDPPKAKEVRIKILCTGVCHTDWYTLSGKDPEGLFPSVLGHEGCGIVESIGSEVTTVNVGDVVIPLYIPECKECKFCLSGKTNLCQSIRSTQGRGLMPDETRRFRGADGQELYHFMGTSTFAQYTVLPEISVAVINPAVAGKEKEACLLGCGVTTGVGAVRNTMQVEAGSTVAVFGLGGVGLSVIQGARMNGASRIIGVDIDPNKFDLAKELGGADCVDVVDPRKLGDTSVEEAIRQMTDGGVDYSFECIGNTATMRAALECCHKGWGKSCIIGVAEGGAMIQTRPFQLVTGRSWHGSAFGGTKGRTGVPEMVEEFLAGNIEITKLITDVLPLERINEAFMLMKQREKLSIRTVVNMW